MRTMKSIQWFKTLFVLVCLALPISALTAQSAPEELPEEPPSTTEYRGAIDPDGAV